MHGSPASTASKLTLGASDAVPPVHEEIAMTRNESTPSDRNTNPAPSVSGRERDLEQLDRRAHGGTQNGSTGSARDHQLSEQAQRTGGPTRSSDDPNR
jgi:hypothetical protein